MTQFTRRGHSRERLPGAGSAVPLLLALVLNVGCAALPWTHCDTCHQSCEVAPDCFGYYPTCWRPWPCPNICPVWEPEADEAVEMMPDPGEPADEIPFEDQTMMPPIPTVDPIPHGTASLRPLPETTSEGVIQAGWPGEEVAPPAAQTPFPSRALSTAEYSEP